MKNFEKAYTAALFALWRLTELPEYKTLSQLCYVLDERSVLKFLEFFGGQTVRIPTRDELEEVLVALTLQEDVTVNEVQEETAIRRMLGDCTVSIDSRRRGVELYHKLKEMEDEFETIT